MVTESELNFYLVLGTYVLVIVTSIGIGFSLWFTRKSLKHTENQLKEMKESNRTLKLDLIHKIKPTLRLAKFTQILNEPDPLNPTFSFEIQNVDGSSVDNLEVYCAEHYPNQGEPFTIQNFLTNPPKLHSTYKAISTLLAGEKTQKIEFIPTGNDSRIDIIIWTKYEFLDGEKSEIIQVVHFEDWKYHSHNGYRKRKLDEIREKINSK